MPEQTREEYAVFWGDTKPLAECASLRQAEYAVVERRFRATFEPHSCFYEPLPQGEPRYLRRTVTTIRSDWEDVSG